MFVFFAMIHRQGRQTAWMPLCDTKSLIVLHFFTDYKKLHPVNSLNRIDDRQSAGLVMDHLETISNCD